MNGARKGESSAGADPHRWWALVVIALAQLMVVLDATIVNIALPSFMPVFATATAGVAPRDSGVTSATVNTAQQVGGSIGTALLNTIATTSSAGYVAARLHSPAQKAPRERVPAQAPVPGSAT